MTQGQGHKANDVFAPRGAWQSGVNADFFALGYDAFGSLLQGRHEASNTYRFGFQGQEKDDEIHNASGTSLAFEYRMHDPRLGRFTSIDPLAAQYPWNSPYAFAENRVIDGIDLEGLEYRRYPNWTETKALLGRAWQKFEWYAARDFEGYGDPTNNGGTEYGGPRNQVKGVTLMVTTWVTIATAGTFATATTAGRVTMVAEEVFSQTTGLPFSPRDVVDMAKGLNRLAVRFITNKSSNKVAVIGQGMADVNKMAESVPGAETFKASDAAQAEWEQLKKAAVDGRVSDEVAQGSQMYKENQSWVQKIKDEGYNVIDLGAQEGANPSTFYNMELQTIGGQ